MTRLSLSFLTAILAPPFCASAQAPAACETQIAFSPRGDALGLVLRELRAAQRSVDAALFYLSHADLIDALCRLGDGGRVQVRVLVDIEAARPADRHILDHLVRHHVRVFVLPSSGGKMHMKCAVVDGETVITGAANWTSQAFDHNVEDTIVLRSPGVARDYHVHFESLVARSTAWASAEVGVSSSPAVAPPGTTARVPSEARHREPIASECAEVFLSPGRAGQRRLGEQIMAATSRVDVALYLLNDTAMRKAVMDKAKLGVVPVRLLVDKGMLAGSLRPVLQDLAEAGVEIAWWNAGRGSMHLKTAVIDERYVWTGSANWTPSAFDLNTEDLLQVDAPRVAETYARYLDGLHARARPFQAVGATAYVADQGEEQRRDGFLVGLPLTGPRTNWNDVLNKQVLASFDTTGTVTYVRDEDYCPVLLDLLGSARQSVLIAMYVWPSLKDDERYKSQLKNALISAAKRGVYVYLVLDMPSGEGDELARAHEDWAEELRAQGVDVRLHVPTASLHSKLVVVDLARVLLGSHNWSEGALSGRRVYESSALVELPRQDRRWANYIFGLETVSDMRSRESWQDELRRIRQLSGLRGKHRESYRQQLEDAL